MGRSSDFRFWEEKLPVDHGDQFHLQNLDEDQVGLPSSPPLWTKSQNEMTPLLPNKNHRHSCTSPTSRLRAIMDGRGELMEMIKNLPESSYELSLKDMVDGDGKNVDEVQEKKVERKTEDRIPQKSKMAKSMCRTESMESEVFLLKMFLPVSFKMFLPVSFKKKTNVRKQSEGCENKGSKEWWKMIFVDVKDSKKSGKINRSTSDVSSNRNTTSLDENSMIPCKWSFSKKKSKSTGQRGCLF